jgi:hypothetical protein
LNVIMTIMYLTSYLAGYEGYAVRHIVHIVQCIERVVVRYITVYPYVGRGFLLV